MFQKLKYVGITYLLKSSHESPVLCQFENLGFVGSRWHDLLLSGLWSWFHEVLTLPMYAASFDEWTICISVHKLIYCLLAFTHTLYSKPWYYSVFLNTREDAVGSFYPHLFFPTFIIYVVARSEKKWIHAFFVVITVWLFLFSPFIAFLSIPHFPVCILPRLFLIRAPTVNILSFWIWFWGC